MTFKVVDELIIGTTDVLTTLNGKANTSALSLLAPLASPALTRTATAVNLTVSGNLINGATNVLTSLNGKAPLARPALTGTATAVNVTVSGNRINGTTNVLNELGTKATTTDLALNAPSASPVLTGTATASNLTVSRNFTNGTTNVLTALNRKVRFISDPLLLDIIEVDTIRSKTTGQAVPNVKFDGSIAVVGNVNNSGSFILMVDGLSIVYALNGNATLTGATVVGHNLF